MKVSIVCPLYNAEKYIEKLHSNILEQKKDFLEELEIKYVLTESKDNTEELLKKLQVDYILIDAKDFSHSKTREMMAYKATGDILVFISQDVVMKNDLWLKNLVEPIINNECEAAFSRQLCTNNSIEKYIRENNYPEKSRVVSEKDIDQYGLLTFFYSDASSAIRKDVYLEVNGYDGKNLIINEDMYIAYKIITSGYRIKYCADSEVYHSHVFTLKQLYNRYFDTGVFLKQHSYLLQYKANESGFKLAKYAFKRSIKERNISVLLNLIPNFGARFIGSNLGKRFNKLPRNFIIKSSLNKNYWI
ncbi:rhamnosyltransferase [Clostridium collagenovorans DSM 3089]|uniref:Rhamnosyltransferase n=1 Tax=Clostridium collagenovorans DSM 3089 TaxID=1121306 RepID=A0A1M5YN53_9CLOT|nr:glycosyltransferase [Clostridium collagenovorans]SHI13517.1 rhamnosyltransferase [Clostridium collagenovorans DSM 3089]